MTSRRTFLSGCAVLPFAIAAPTAIAQTLSDPHLGRDVMIDIADQPLGYRLGIIQAQKPVVIEILPTGPVALIALCTYRGCVLKWWQSEVVWACPCCNTHFARNGTMLRGVGKSDLIPAKITFAGGDMIIHNQVGEIETWSIPQI